MLLISSVILLQPVSYSDEEKAAEAFQQLQSTSEQMASL